MRHVRNPVPLFLDRGILRGRYTVRTRDGLACQLRSGRGDRRSFYETVIRNDYLSQGQRLIAGDTVIDIGANIGCFSILAAHMVGCSGRVIAVEPELESYQQLIANLARSGQTNVLAKRAAIGGRQGTVTLYVSKVALFSSVFRYVDGRHNPGMAQEVPMATLEQVMEEARIERCNYLKVDCEGCEYDIFMTMSVGTASRIDQITMETHRVEGRDRKELIGRLCELGFKIHDGPLLYASR